MRKFAGIILFTISTILSGYCIISLIDVLFFETKFRSEVILIITGVMIPSLFFSYYVIVTKFGKASVSPDDHKRITYENEVIKLKIEQRKLQNELKELQANKK